MDKFNEIFGKNLHKIMKKRNISQKELAKGSGIPYSTINGYLHQRNDPSLKQCLAICSYLDVTVDSLCFSEHQIDNQSFMFKNPELQKIARQYFLLNGEGK